MKSLTMTLMVATAGLMIASSVASAQTLKAEIPFNFRAGSTMMTAGTYTVSATLGEKFFALSNNDTSELIMLMPRTAQDPPKAWQAGDRPALGFVCGDSGCSLSRIWTARGGPARGFATPQTGDEKPGSLSLIRMVVVKSK